MSEGLRENWLAEIRHRHAAEWRRMGLAIEDNLKHYPESGLPSPYAEAVYDRHRLLLEVERLRAECKRQAAVVWWLRQRTVWEDKEKRLLQLLGVTDREQIAEASIAIAAEGRAALEKDGEGKQCLST